MLKFRSFYILGIVCLFFLLLTLPAQAAMFEHYDNGFNAEVMAETEVDGGPSDRQGDGNGGYPDTGAMTSAWSDNSDGDSVYAGSDTGGSAFISNNRLDISMGAMTNAEKMVSSGWGWAYAEGYTSTGEGDGIFFQIIPESGEANGNRVDITLDWSGQMSKSYADQGWANLNGGSHWGSEDIAVTVNGTIVWSHDAVALDNDSDTDFDDSDTGFFSAQIGDIIGIYMGVSSGGGTGSYDSFDTDVEQSIGLTMETSAVPVPGAFLLLGSGLIGLIAFKRKS